MHLQEVGRLEDRLVRRKPPRRPVTQNQRRSGFQNEISTMYFAKWVHRPSYAAQPTSRNHPHLPPKQTPPKHVIPLSSSNVLCTRPDSESCMCVVALHDSMVIVALVPDYHTCMQNSSATLVVFPSPIVSLREGKKAGTTPISDS